MTIEKLEGKSYLLFGGRSSAISVSGMMLNMFVVCTVFGCCDVMITTDVL